MRLRFQKDLPIVSATLVVINVIIYLICTFVDNLLLYYKGSLDIVSVLERGEYGRIISFMFLHGDINHIFNNMVILFFLGAMIEKEIGHIKYLLLYFLSGIGSGLVSLGYKAMTHDIASSIGASGAVFGLDGALLALILFSDREIAPPSRVFLMIAYSLYSGFVGGNIDNAAHIGGLVIGFIVGFVICKTDKRNRKNKREVRL